MTAYIAVVSNYWGKGDTIPEAIREVEKSSRKRQPNAILYRVPVDAVVDSHGFMRYVWNGVEPVRLGNRKELER